jgi:hypothetical protein
MTCNHVSKREKEIDEETGPGGGSGGHTWHMAPPGSKSVCVWSR